MDLSDSKVLYCHFFLERNKGVIKTIKLKLKDLNITISQLKQEIKNKLEALSSNTSNNQNLDPLFRVKTINKTLFSRNLTDNLKLSSFFNNRDDLFCEVEINIKPIKTPLIKQDIKTEELLKYKVLSKYAFYEATKQIVKIIIDLPGISDLPKENIKSFFSETSIEIKVNNLKNINYSFGVPRLYKSIDPEKSEAKAVKDQLIIRLRKAKEEDHWNELFRTRSIGE